VGVNPQGVAVADFNRDGRLDFITVNSGANTLSVVASKGDGTFAAPVTVTLGANQTPVAVAAGDFDNDTKTDFVVVTNKTAAGAAADISVQIWKNTTAGVGDAPAFALAGTKQLSNTPTDVVAVFLDTDNKLDVVVGESAAGTALERFLGDGAGGLGAGQVTALADSVRRLSVVRGSNGLPAATGQGSFDGNATNDLAVLFTLQNKVQVVLSNGNGTFDTSKTPITLAGMGTTQDLAVGKFNGDSNFDVVAVTLDKAQLLTGKGDGTLQGSTVVVPFPMAANQFIVAGDFNNDGKLDFAVSGGPGSSSINVQLGRGDGTFLNSSTTNAGVAINDLAAADFNSDDLLDLVLVNADNKARVLFNTTKLTPVVIPVTPVEHQPFTGPVAQFVDADLSALLGDYTATIDWGDGSPMDNGIISQPGGPGTPFFVSGTHTYRPEGTYTIRVVINDNRDLLTLTVQVAANVLEGRPPGVTNSAQAYVNEVYEDLFGRNADAEGLATWGNRLLNPTVTRADVARQIVNSTEGLATLVRDAYRLILGRAADPAGLVGWVNFLARGGSMAQVRAQLASSPEFFLRNGVGNDDTFLTALYARVLGRAVDLSGRNSFRAQFAAGATRTQVALVVFTSTEFLTKLVSTGFNVGGVIIPGYYQRFLNRVGDSLGVNNLVGLMQRGFREQEAIVSLASSPEYVARLG
jgi:hypothetical protein